MSQAAKQITTKKARSRVTGSRSLKKAGGARDARGLDAEAILIVGENASEFDEFATKIIEHFEPVGPVEQELVELVIGLLLWRLKRIPRFEAAVIGARDAATAKSSPAKQDQASRNYRLAMAARYRLSRELNQQPSGDDTSDTQEKEVKVDESLDPQEAIARALIHDRQNGDVLGQILRYEASLKNTLARELSMLMTLQSARGKLGRPAKEMPRIASR